MMVFDKWHYGSMSPSSSHLKINNWTLRRGCIQSTLRSIHPQINLHFCHHVCYLRDQIQAISPHLSLPHILMEFQNCNPYECLVCCAHLPLLIYLITHLSDIEEARVHEDQRHLDKGPHYDL